MEKGPKSCVAFTAGIAMDRKGLDVAGKKKVREGTLLARRTAAVAKRATLSRKPWIMEQRKWRERGASMYMLDELVEVAEMAGVVFHKFDQCRFGCEFQKSTDLLSHIGQDNIGAFSPYLQSP